MSSIMSFALVSFNLYLQCSGNIKCFEASFFNTWTRFFSVVFALAVPIVLVVAPFITRMVNKIA